MSRFKPSPSDFTPVFPWESLEERSAEALEQLIRGWHHCPEALLGSDRRQPIGCDIEAVAMLLRTDTLQTQPVIVPRAEMPVSEELFILGLLPQLRYQSPRVSQPTPAESVMTERIQAAAAETGTLALAALTVNAERNNPDQRQMLLWIPKCFRGLLAPGNFNEATQDAYAAEVALDLLYEFASQTADRHID